MIVESSDHDPILEVAQRVFSIQHLYPFQRLVVSNTIEGTDQIVVFPTGGGKSLCFQVPSQMLGGPTVVIIPLLSLLKDQVQRLQSLGIEVGVLIGGLSDAEKQKLTRRTQESRIRLIYATPEAAVSPANRKHLRAWKPAHVVVDEAHCVAEWGESFRPAYLELGSLVQDLDPAVVSAFTATASERVLATVRANLFGPRTANLVMGDPDRPNIRYSVSPVLSKQRGLLATIMANRKPVLVFARTRRNAEQYAWAVKRQLPTEDIYFYHAGLSHEERRQVETWYLSSKDGILVSTSAYGMGVDKGNIRTVVHADVSRSPESYLQETGRAGRDGKVSRAHLLYSSDDLLFLRSIDDQVAGARYRTMIEYSMSTTVCRRELLLARLNADSHYCAGCDICAGDVTLSPEGLSEIRGLVSRRRRVFTDREAVSILLGKGNFDTARRSLDGNREYGSLATWSEDQLDEAVANLKAASVVVTPSRGFWKHRLTIDRRHAASDWQDRLRMLLQ